MLQRRVWIPPSAGAWWPSSFHRTMPEELRRFVRYLLFLMVVSIALYLYVRPASQISATQLRIAELQAEYARLQRENAELTRQLAIYTDIRRIEARARELGYQPPESRMFVRIMLVLPAPTAAAPTNGVSISARWQKAVDWLTKRLELFAYAPLEH